MLLAIFFCFLSVCSASDYFLNEEECLNYTVYPVQYELTLIPYIFSGQQRSYYDCEVVITVIANVNVRIIELDAKNLQIKRDSVKVMFEDVDIINKARPFEYDKVNGKLYLHLSEDLEPYNLRRAKYLIKISFTKELSEDEKGIFLVRYSENGREKQVITTRLSPDKAKYFFPCFDNPQFEAVYKFRVYVTPQRSGVQHLDKSLVIANELRRIGLKDNYEVIEYIPSPQVGVHQIGFHYSDFHHKQVTAKSTNDTLILWAPSTSMREYSEILHFGQRIIDIIQEYSGVTRPLVNGPINLVAVPSKNLVDYEICSWNLLTIGDYRLAYTPQYTSIRQKQEMSYLLAQQLTRIWLGNPGETERTRWKQEWFKEGMSTYLAHYFLAREKSFWDMSMYGMQIRNRAMIEDHPHAPNLESFNRTLAIHIPSRYQRLVEFKTAALLWMVENWIGPEKLHWVLAKYIFDRRGKFISVEDFTHFLQQETVECEFFKGSTVADVLHSWIKQPGYPVVKVIVYKNQGTQDVVYLEQKQFTIHNTTRSTHKYLIPISYIAQFTEDCYNCFQPKFTISDSGYTFKENLNNGWIIINRKASGYYRVNYDNDTWRKIIAAMKGPDRLKIDYLNRAQIINDAFALYMSGDIEELLAKDIISCLETEEHPAVWEAAFSGFELLKTRNAPVEMTKFLYNEWKAFMREMISLMYRRVANDFERDQQTRDFRSKIIHFACFIGHTPCLNDLRSSLEQIRRKSTYDPDLRQICYYTALNQSYGYDLVRDNNRFEKEDFELAKKSAEAEVYFTYKLRNGGPRPMPLRLSSTSTTPVPIVVKPDTPLGSKKSSSAVVHRVSVLLMTASLLFITSR